MSYQALYRKWRPKTFDEVKGQDAIITTLKNQVASGRIGHAYLFCGTRGTGKTSVAKILARAVNCERSILPDTDRDQEHDRSGAAQGPESGMQIPCNECETCLSILNESSMNVIEIDAASNNGVDNIRDIREQVQYPPSEGRYKVFIIDEVHMLSPGAFNALLKTLEEPPEYVIFILATTEVHKIPVTVLSRCQRYDFRRISAATISERLKELTDAEGIKIEEKAIGYIAVSADGAMRDALSLLDECTAFHPGEELTYDMVLQILGAADTAAFGQLFNAVIQGSAPAALKVIGEAVEEGRELLQFTTDFLWFMRNLLVIKTADDPTGIIDASRESIESMKVCAAAATKDALMRYIRVIAELVGRMRYSSQKRVLLELAVIRLMTPQQELDTDALLERISRLENMIGSGPWIRGSYGMPASVNEAAAVSGTDGGQDRPDGETGESHPLRLQKAQYDDLMKLRDEWKGMIAELTGANKVFLRETSVETADGDTLLLVFDRADHFNSAHRDSAVREIEELVKQKYNKEFSFVPKLRGSCDIPSSYVTEDELADIVKMEIEIEIEE